MLRLLYNLLFRIDSMGSVSMVIQLLSTFKVEWQLAELYIFLFLVGFWKNAWVTFLNFILSKSTGTEAHLSLKLLFSRSCFIALTICFFEGFKLRQYILFIILFASFTLYLYKFHALRTTNLKGFKIYSSKNILAEKVSSLVS